MTTTFGKTLVILAVALSLGGCVVVQRRPGTTASARSRPACHPSEHWDGHRCVHNGKAKGHHKHDD